MVGEQLPNHRRGKSEGKPRRVWYDDVPVGFGDGFGADGENFSASCPNLGNAGFVLRKKRVVGQQHYRWAVLIYERESAVLEFAKRHGVRVEIRDFFELERGFRGDGQHVPASEEKQVLVL